MSRIWDLVELGAQLNQEEIKMSKNKKEEVDKETRPVSVEDCEEADFTCGCRECNE